MAFSCADELGGVVDYGLEAGVVGRLAAGVTMAAGRGGGELSWC